MTDNTTRLAAPAATHKFEQCTWFPPRCLAGSVAHCRCGLSPSAAIHQEVETAKALPSYAVNCHSCGAKVELFPGEAAEAWQDISSAPKDCSWILGITLAGRQVVVRWGGGAWEDDNRLCRDPIKWQPLPPPPKPEPKRDYLTQSCTEGECRLCRLPLGLRKEGMRHAGLIA